MQVTNTSFTIAEYAEQMNRQDIIVNRDYQRTEEVWPPAARSYLIETILLGYPVPKLSLFQKTDLKSRKTTKEIVDGQQRSSAILDFYNGTFRVTGKSPYSGKSFEKLDDDDKQRFLSYPITVDLIINATEEEIRQLFRRINSYTVPLNPQEIRHATHQGAFKWFVVDLSEKYATSLKSIGVFTEKQLSRMADATLFTEIVMASVDGIETASKKKLNEFYAGNDVNFPQEAEMRERVDLVFEKMLEWRVLHRGNLMKPYNFFTLFLAVSHLQRPIVSLSGIYPPQGLPFQPEDVLLSNLSDLANSLDMEPDADGAQDSEGEDEDTDDIVADKFKDFIDACSEATNTERQRKERFRWLCRAMNQPHL